MAEPFGGSIDIPCPVCGESFTKRIADLQRTPEFPCPTVGCAGYIDATDLAAELTKLGDDLDGLSGDLTIKL